jgi:Xaa-Pro aminopeptidase
MRYSLPMLLCCAGALAAQVPTCALAVPAEPIGRWVAVPALPGMGRAVDTAAVAVRRRALLARIGRGIALIPAAHDRVIELDHQQDTDFRQDDTFFHFTDLETHDAWLLLTASDDSTHVTLLLPPRDSSEERWTGLQLGPDSLAARLSGIRDVVSTDSLEARFGLAAQTAGPVYVWLEGLSSDERQTVDLAFAGHTVRNLRPLVDSLRFVKDADALRRLRTAIDITVRGHIAGMQATRPGMWEYQLEAVIEGTFRAHGADRVGYPSFVGSGPNSTTLHYDVNRREMRAGDLVSVDAGAEWGQYTADVTRTFPVSGRFTPRQKAIYDLVLATQRATFDSVRPGVLLDDLDRIARRYMRDHSGKLCGTRTCDAYFVHALGHWLGMDVHDPGDHAIPLSPGVVLTLEPGIYLPAESLGVRIEDDVLVTATGGEWLSDKAPKTTEAIERLMGVTPRPSRP